MKIWSSDQYKDWFNGEIEEYHRSVSPDIPKLDYLESACWFVTITFNRHHIDKRQAALDRAKNDTSMQATDFDFLYQKIALATNPNKEIGLFPFALMALDFEGSRGKVSSFANQNVHGHAVFCVPLSLANSAQRYLDGPRFRQAIRGLTSVDSIKVIRYDRSKDKKGTLVTYVAKAFLKVEASPTNVKGLRIYRGHEADFKLNRYQPKKSPKRENRVVTKMIDAVRSLRAEASAPIFDFVTDTDEPNIGTIPIGKNPN